MSKNTTTKNNMQSETISSEKGSRVTVGTINNVGGTYWAIFLNGRRARTLTNKDAFATKEEAIAAARGVIHYA